MKSRVTLFAVACALLAPVAQAQSESPAGPPPPSQLPTRLPPAAAQADDKADAAEMAKKLANPIGALISVPFQSNFDFGGGPAGDGFQYKLNLQPIVPISLNQDWLAHLAHDSPVRLPGEHLRHLQPDRSVGHRAEPLPFAGQTHTARLDLGSRAGASSPDRHG